MSLEISLSYAVVCGEGVWQGNSLTMHIFALLSISFLNNRLWLGLWNVSDAPKHAENTGVTLFTQYDTICLSRNAYSSVPYWV